MRFTFFFYILFFSGAKKSAVFRSKANAGRCSLRLRRLSYTYHGDGLERDARKRARFGVRVVDYFEGLRWFDARARVPYADNDDHGQARQQRDDLAVERHAGRRWTTEGRPAVPITCPARTVPVHASSVRVPGSVRGP